MKHLSIGKKIYLGFGVILFFTLVIGIGAQYISSQLQNRIAGNHRLEEYISLGSQLQEEASRWLIQRENLSRQTANQQQADKADGTESPLATYTWLLSQLTERAITMRQQGIEETESQSLNEIEQLFRQFDAIFQEYQGQFNQSVKLMDQLRKQATVILTSSISLQKAVKRQTKKLNSQLHGVQKKMGPQADSQALLTKAMEIQEKLQGQAKRQGYSSILINKPLGFQEMAKDFVIYQETKSGSGLIVDIEKLLGIDKNATMGVSLPAMQPFFNKGREAKLFAVINRDTGTYLNLFKEYYRLSQSIKKTMTRLEADQSKLQDQISALRRRYVEQTGNYQKRTSHWLFVITATALLLGMALAWRIKRVITLQLLRMIEQLKISSTQVASISGLLSGSSQILAESSSEQAAGIEETSSSLEEMASMAHQNSNNAGQADSLMKETIVVIQQTRSDMIELMGSINEISKAIEETHKIIKTIDGIAFQTNLLALNAAVEAARAGEAGAGFAVVADEVRNLAIRAAEAANNTSDLIKGTSQKITVGAELMNRTNKGFHAISKSASKVRSLVSEISTASNEQAQGVDQINNTVMEIDKAVQNNAAAAEKSASSSEEMISQAEEMKMMIFELDALVEGGKSLTKNQKVKTPVEQQELKRITSLSGVPIFSRDVPQSL